MHRAGVGVPCHPAQPACNPGGRDRALRGVVGGVCDASDGFVAHPNNHARHFDLGGPWLGRGSVCAARDLASSSCQSLYSVCRRVNRG